MTSSPHNFFYGAFDPSAILSIDKPPLDLWLQVISVKLLGWGGFALKLPEALGGTLAVPLLYDTVRRAADPAADELRWSPADQPGHAARRRPDRRGALRLVARYRCGPRNRGWAACGAAAQWIRQTGKDVTPAGLSGPSRLYLLSAARAG